MVDTTIKLAGAVSFWRLAALSDLSVLKTGWESAGFGEYVPSERENVSILKEALGDIFTVRNRMLVRPLSSKNGFTVVKEVRGEDGNEFQNILNAKVYQTTGDELPIIVGDQRYTTEIREKFAALRGKVTSTQVAFGLVGILSKLAGVSLRPRGGFYFLPEESITAWREASVAVEKSGDNSIYLMKTAMDAETVLAVKDAIVAEAETESKRLMEEILSGDIGSRAIKARKEEARKLQEKVAEYEKLLGVGLAHIKESLDRVEQAGATVSILAAADFLGGSDEVKQEEAHNDVTA